MTVKRVPSTPPSKVNEKGEFLSLLAASSDGRELKMYVENGAIGPDMTPGTVKERFPQYKNTNTILFQVLFVELEMCKINKLPIEAK